MSSGDLLRILIACAIPAAAGCEREARRFDDGAAMSALSPRADALLTAGGVPSALEGGHRELAIAQGERYQHNAWAISEGKRWFSWFNCIGCHGEGGGGSGPPLMDATWIYGESVADIATTIVHGRPNGMPAYGGKLTQQQVFQLAAYVRSLSGSVPMHVAPGRRDSMSVKNPEVMKPGVRNEDAP